MELAHSLQYECTDENMTLPFANIGANRPAEADTLEGDLPDALKRPKGRMVADRGMA